MPRTTGKDAFANRARRGYKNSWERRPQRSTWYEPASTQDHSNDTMPPATAFALCTPTINEAQEKLSQAAIAREKMLERGRMLWSSNYAPLLEKETLEVPELWAQVTDVYAGQLSSYRKRLGVDMALKYDAKTAVMVRDTVATLRRRKNKDDIPFSIMARSLSYFNQRVPTRVWREQQKSQRIVHRDTCQKLLDAMLETEPEPPWVINKHVSVFCVDQCNHWQVAATSKKGQHRGAERLDSQGMPIVIRSETVLNVVQRQVPFTEGLLTADEIELITEKGPYTEDPQLVLVPLNPLVVERDIWEWVCAVMLLLCPRPALHVPPLDEQMPRSHAEVAARVLGKPSIKPRGPTHMKIHPSIPKCDTKSFLDMQKLWPIIVYYCCISCICMIILGDGQTVELMRTCRRHWPKEYKSLLIGNGHFHSLAHLCFCLIEGYWKSCLCMFALWQHKDKQIYEEMKDLQHDNAKHALDFHRVNVAGVLSYLVLDVVTPPPQLLLTDPKAYLACVNNPGATAAITYVFFAGIPVLTFQRAIRKSDGACITKCLAYAFHCHRCFAFKIKSVYICMTVLMGLTTAHPKLVRVLEAHSCVSLFGRIWMAFDRFLEYVNLLQQKRGTAFRGFDSQLHFTKYLKPLIHADAAWKDACGLGISNDDGIPAYLYNDVHETRRKLRAALGTDLTLRVPGNALWHTGNAVPLTGGDYRERQPLLWWRMTADGRAAGKGRANAMKWSVFGQKYLDEHWEPI